MTDAPPISRQNRVDISVIVPVLERHSDVELLFAQYKTGIERTGASYEFVFVVDGPYADVTQGLARLTAAGERVMVVQMTRSFGEATALGVGFERASGEVLLTLPGYFQIEASTGIESLIASLQHADLVIGRRDPRKGSWLESLRRKAFHGLLALVTRLRFNDLGCGARALRREVADEIHLYGDQHRFLAVLADRQGFRVREQEVRQSAQDTFRGTYPLREYARALLDIFTVFFLVRFTKKPLRFFGMLGVGTFGVGALVLLYLVVERLFLDQPLADRPALLLTSLLVVLGLQLFALGLLGELIIFTHARNLKDYKVAEVIEFPARDAEPTAQVAELERRSLSASRSR